MRIQFCGADRTVTGSCHLIEVNGLRLLLDLGMYQGPRDEARRMNHFLPEAFKSLDAIILSHGHLDHCGRLPAIVKQGFNKPIYCTSATAEVARIVLLDAAKIQEEDAEYLNRRERAPGEPAIEPLFRSTDAAAVLKLWKRVKCEQKTDLGNGVSFTLYDAGHILGSTYVVIEWTEDGQARRLLFTADVGRYNTPILRDPHPLPGLFDYVITESTYGDRTHAPMDQIAPQLLDAVNFCIEHKSRMLMPAFAVGRTQTMLWYIQRFIQNKQIPQIPIFVDSPMGSEVSQVTEDHPEAFDEETLTAIGKQDLFGTSQVTFAVSGQESKNINSVRGACVIIASSPTCEFGRILHHLKQSIEQPNDLIVFGGWTPPGTLGRRLQSGEKRVRVFDRFYEVRCQVRIIHGLSAHADSDELLKFLTPTLDKRTSAFVVHGEADQSEMFARKLLARGIGIATVPAMNTSVITSPSGLPLRGGDSFVAGDGD